MLIKLEKVRKVYRMGQVDLTVLKDVDLEIEAGSFTTILGPSGSGKSTLLHIVSCLDTPTEGRVFLDGQDVSELSGDQLADIRGRKIGFVFQRFNLLMNLSAIDNAALPLVFQGVSEAERKARAEKILTELGLGHRLNHRPNEMSGGEQQRVALSRALINDPDILVADEPTGNVDTKTGQKIMELLASFHQQGKTIIVVTHDLKIAAYGQDIVELRDGEIIDRRQTV
ncbi:MAG TPA: ABC transporter ATP-binding protein [Candidatus Pacearchaeota archaeon]|nr:ABC transporter ATP-binding protein [Candidatus Pacearchaeota archaeon]